MSGFDLTLDLIQAAGSMKQIATGKSNKYAQLSGVVRQVGERVQTYNDNQNVLQAKRDIALGTVNQGLRELSDTYNVTVMHNNLQTAGNEIADFINNGGEDDTSPDQFAEKIAGVSADWMTKAGDSSMAVDMVTRWVSENQAKMQGVQANRYRDKLYKKQLRETEVATFQAVQDGSFGVDDGIAMYNSVRAVTKTPAEAEAILLSSALGRAQLGDDTAIIALSGRKADGTRIITPTQVNIDLMRAIGKEYDSFKADEYSQGKVDSRLAIETAISTGTYNPSMWAVHDRDYGDTYSSKEKLNMQISFINRNRAFNNRKQAVQADVKGFRHGAVLALKDRNTAAKEWAVPVLANFNKDPIAVTAEISAVLNNNPTITVLRTAYENSIMTMKVDADGNVDEQAVIWMQSAMELYKRNGAKVASSAVGGASHMVEYVINASQGLPGGIEKGMRDYYNTENTLRVVTPAMRENTEADLDDLVDAALEAAGGSNGKLSIIPDTILGYNTGFTARSEASGMQEEIRREADRMWLAGDGIEYAAVLQNAANKVANRYSMFGGQMVREEYPGELQTILGSEPSKFVDWLKDYKTFDAMTAFTLPEVSDETIESGTFTVNRDRRHILFTAADGRITKIPTSMAVAYKKAQDDVTRLGLLEIDQRKGRAVTVAENQVYEREKLRLLEAANPETQMHQLQRTDNLAGWRRVYGDRDPNDLQHLEGAALHETIKAIHSGNWQYINSTLQRYWNEMKSIGQQPADK